MYVSKPEMTKSLNRPSCDEIFNIATCNFEFGHQELFVDVLIPETELLDQEVKFLITLGSLIECGGGAGW